MPLLQAAVDFRSDPVLYEACKEDSESLCLGVDHGGGRIQACLVRGGGADRIQATLVRAGGPAGVGPRMQLRVTQFVPRRGAWTFSPPVPGDHTGVVLFLQAWHDKCMQVSWACTKRLECSHCLHVLSP